MTEQQPPTDPSRPPNPNPAPGPEHDPGLADMLPEPDAGSEPPRPTTDQPIQP